jgi:hypothetical protein
MAAELISTEPATGATLWRGPVSDVAAEVEIARGACSVFRVVLTPAYDKAHHDHFHLDLGPDRLCGI